MQQWITFAYGHTTFTLATSYSTVSACHCVTISTNSAALWPPKTVLLLWKHVSSQHPEDGIWRLSRMQWFEKDEVFIQTSIAFTSNTSQNNVPAFIRQQHIKRMQSTVPSRSRPSLQFSTEACDLTARKHSVTFKPSLSDLSSPFSLLLTILTFRRSCAAFLYLLSDNPLFKKLPL